MTIKIYTTWIIATLTAIIILDAMLLCSLGVSSGFNDAITKIMINLISN